METVTLSSKGQLVIPSHVRATADLHPGDTLEVRYFNGEIRLRPVAPAKSTTLDEVAGCLAGSGQLAITSPKPLSDAQVRTAIKARLRAEDESTLSRSGRSRKPAA